MEEPKLNDGNGLYDNIGLCDTLIVNLNDLVKKLSSGECIAFCALVVQMTQKITNLKAGIRADLDSKDKTIEELKRINKELSEQLTKKDGAQDD